MLHGDLLDLVKLLLHLLLDLLLLPHRLLAELLEQVLEGLLLAELLELLQRAGHTHGLLQAVRLLGVALLLPERLLLVLLVGGCARELLALLLSQVAHLRGGAHAGVTFP
ncbi:hypothetical protein GCM10022403_013330 [Streptomyces coacervatus]|uniref:Secreted protein n=1 Tax=Streptomyces coacervatus TaxID=647381 RepID=A0ABP7H157_9ACTN